jgi:phage tail sheath protein FI
MPEYLAPAVYVEEVDTGSKPIEGVSTSTSGFIGMTERGPVDVPILVTSAGEYARWFGQGLNPIDFGDHRFLPQAVEGFFINGGKRLFVTRILDRTAALAARGSLVGPVPGAPMMSQLALAVSATANSIVVIDNPPPNFALGNTIEIDTGANAEYRDINAPPAAFVPMTLDLPTALAYPSGVNGEIVPIAAPVDAIAPNNWNSTLTLDAMPGATSISVVNATAGVAIAAGNVLRVGAAAEAEYVFVAGAPQGNTIPLRTPLQAAHAATAPVARQGALVPAAGSTLNAPAPTGSVVLSVAAPFGAAGSFVLLSDLGNPPAAEIRRLGELRRIALTPPPQVGVPGGATHAQYPAGSRVERVPLPAAPVQNIALQQEAARGATTVDVADRSAFLPGDLVVIGAAPATERVIVLDKPGSVAGPDPGVLVLGAPLRRTHAAGANMVGRVAMAAIVPNLAGVLAVTSPADATEIFVATQGPLIANDWLRIRTPGGGTFFHRVNGAAGVNTPVTLSLNLPVDLGHAAAATVTVRQPMITVRAIDAGAWGNRLRVGMEPQPTPMVRTTIAGPPLGAFQLRLASSAGVEAGTELVVTAGVLTANLKVQQVDRQNNFLITLDPTTALPGWAIGGTAVTSREYRFIVELMRQPDAIYPARNTIAIDREVFNNLSLDPRHSRYIERVVGVTWNLVNPATAFDDSGRPLRRADRRSEGESAYVRVRDLNPVMGLRAGPIPTYETLADGSQRLILLPLDHGDDQVGGVGDNIYIGNDNVNPELRSGLWSLTNIEEISIVAAPGRTSVGMQGALINHCERMRYRFAVLDGIPPPNDSMNGVQAQRQQFDTKYAALYHPWLLVPDPYPQAPGPVADVPIPPSGHMVGIYARTDIERGVHKAPANEVVRGVVGLQRLLNKEQHDILNPYPVNINVIRDFRPVNRGIRVYGGRCITSDSDWKYVNVRRLLIFIEASIDRGLQWVVFEPNAEPLWARVRRSISNFLTLVWRNGALEGTKPEEAYFVKCDRTTMTQTDIDQGRLIALVGVAPVKPAEFVIVRIGLWTAHAEE